MPSGCASPRRSETSDESASRVVARRATSTGSVSKSTKRDVICTTSVTPGKRAEKAAKCGASAWA